MAKKQRSAKQKAATRKLVARNKRRAKPKRRRSSRPRKANKPRKRSKPMAKRRSFTKKSIASKIPLINNPTFRKAATGIGVATLGVTVLSLVLPQIANQPLVKPVLALLGGGVPGVVAQFLVQGGGNLGNLLGGNGGGGAQNASNGFA